MSKALFPIPVDTPILATPSQFSPTWQRFFKSLSDDLLAASRSNVSGKLTWTLNGNAVFGVFQDPAPGAAVDVALPLASKLPFEALGTVYPAGTKTITIPAGTAFCQFWFIAAWS